MNESKLDDIARDLVDLFKRPNPIIRAVIVADFGLVNGTPQVLVDVRDGQYQAIYLPPIVPEVPGNCFVTRMVGTWVVVASNFQVPYIGGWGSGGSTYVPPESGPASGYDPGTTGGRPAVVTTGQYGWGDQPWGN